jgi:hypothetical protein
MKYNYEQHNNARSIKFAKDKSQTALNSRLPLFAKIFVEIGPALVVSSPHASLRKRSFFDDPTL